MAKIPINIATGTLQASETIVGIDLGTTNSLISIIHPETQKPIAIKDIDNEFLVPSVIHFGENGEIQIGNYAKTFLETDAANTIYSVKRLMGKSYQDVKKKHIKYSYKIIDNDEDQLVKIQIGNHFYSPIELSSFILKELKNRAEHILKTPVNKCVITVPAYFNDAQRQATRDAGKLAGLDVLRIINEPTAASLACGIGEKLDTDKKIAVYDLGGGTFDISILQLHAGIFDVMSTHGNTYLGGDDFDHEIVLHFMKQLGLSEDDLNQQKELAQHIRLVAEKAKKALSHQDDFSSTINEKEIKISKDEFEKLIAPLVDETIESCKMAIKDSGLALNEINGVVMVGGSTRVPLVKQKVKEYFQSEILDKVNPDEVVALGAAIQADILAGNNKDILLLDVTPLSLGLETMGGLMDVLIPRNNKIPYRAARQYTTQKDGQSGIIISIYQGERDLVKDNRKLAQFTLSGIPQMPAGLPKVEIQFMINADGILQVKATELRTGIAQEVEVKPQYGLTDEEVEKMLLDSITHAKEDIQNRALVEALTESENTLQLTENFIQKNKKHIHESEINDSIQAMEELKKMMETKDRNKIMAANENLNNITKPFAERIMDIAIAKTLQGKNI
ncbi:MAG TPA: Fe-S protein assembly chaperone HscA [Chitinophagaceae bacterium]|nr:Fe-S protein assembly chaperone HscA [Chitinophagaceae bacterium]